MNGFAALNSANAALQAKRTRQAVEEQTRVLSGLLADRLRTELNQQWHAILEERDRVWKEVADRMWRKGWEAGWQAAMEAGREREE